MWIASFDIGKRNFAFCVQDIESNTFILLETVDLAQGRKKCPLSIILTRMGKVLDQHLLIWDQCVGILIERQLSRNPQAYRLAQHCQSYFLFLYGTFKYVCMYAPSNKNKDFCIPRGISYYKQKRFAVEVAQKLVEHNSVALTKLNSVSKKDDMADTILQLYSFRQRNGLIEK